MDAENVLARVTHTNGFALYDALGRQIFQRHRASVRAAVATISAAISP